MAKNVTEEQTRRLLELPRLIREIRASVDRIEHIDLPTRRGLFAEHKEKVDEAEALLSERRKILAEAAINQGVLWDKFLKDKLEADKLTAEFEELLKPYDEEIIRQEEEFRALEEREFQKLNTAMSSQGWSTEDCQRAAKRHVADRVDQLGLDTKKDVLARMRRGEDFPAGTCSFWG